MASKHNQELSGILRSTRILVAEVLVSQNPLTAQASASLLRTKSSVGLTFWKVCTGRIAAVTAPDHLLTRLLSATRRLLHERQA